MSKKKKQTPEQEPDKEEKLEESRNTDERRMSGNGKSTPGYISRFRRNNIIWLLVWVALGVAIFVTGMLIWNSRANILTVLAVLMVLPGAKRIVALVAVGRKRSVSLERCQRVEAAVEPFIYAGELDLHKYDPEEDDTEDENQNADSVGDDESSVDGEDLNAEASDNSGENDSATGDSVDEELKTDTADEDEPAVKASNERVIPWNVIFTDYIFTSSEKIMMLDFLVVTEQKILILPASSNQDENYVKKYLKNGIRKWTESMDIKFVRDDDELLRMLGSLHKSKQSQSVAKTAVAVEKPNSVAEDTSGAYTADATYQSTSDQKTLRERRETLAYLKSLAV